MGQFEDFLHSEIRFLGVTDDDVFGKKEEKAAPVETPQEDKPTEIVSVEPPKPRIVKVAAHERVITPKPKEETPKEDENKTDTPTPEDKKPE